MRWLEALNEVSVVECAGADCEIGGVEYDSRRVGPEKAFVAMRGGTTDGNRYIDAAIARGAVAIVTDSAEAYASVRSQHDGFAVARVEHGRRALAELSAAVLGHPERKLAVSAVTGTNGKTTTAWLLEQILRSVGRKCVLIGTIETRIGDEARPSEHTTPEASDLLKIFAEGVTAGCTEVVMEMSSHALEQERVWGIPVDVAIFTNLTQDHLDYHGTMGAYASAKLKLFKGVGAPAPRIALINADDPMSDYFAGSINQSFIKHRYGIEKGGRGFSADDVQISSRGTNFTWRTPDSWIKIQSPLFGLVNVYNLLAALAASLERHVSLEQIAAAVPGLRQVPGRFEVVTGSATTGFTVVVDYAHTDDALRNLIGLGRELVSGHGGRVITMFGCGGDRDRIKRPKMGRAAGEGSDLVVVTSDNPRSEDPMAIIEEALAGVRGTTKKFLVEPDRAAAIELAIRAARTGDIVLLAGKGHEKVQNLRDGPVPFDDVAVAEEILGKLG